MKPYVFALLVMMLAVAVPGYGDIREANDLDRDETGVTIHKDLKRQLPSEQKMFHVAGNVIRAEDYTQYLDRRMTALEEKIDQRFDRLESKLDELQKDSGQAG